MHDCSARVPGYGLFRGDREVKKKKKCWGNMLLQLRDSSRCCTAAESIAVCPAGCRARGAVGAGDDAVGDPNLGAVRGLNLRDARETPTAVVKHASLALTKIISDNS